MSVDLPCSELAEALGEDMAGSAPAAGGFLVVEQPGPWGRDAVRESGLRPVAEELETRAGAAGLKVHVVRRSVRRYAAEPAAAWVARVQPGARSLVRFEVGSIGELLDLPLDGGGGTPQDRPLLLACTHSTRDPCCARRGLPLHRALAAAGADVWHASHLGGHRFAATMAVLPHGLWLGRVPAAEARAVVEAVEANRIPLPYVRGRAGAPPAAQAAELALRRREALDGLDDLLVAGADGDVVTLAAIDGRRWAVTMRHEPTERHRPVSCGPGAKVEDPGRWIVADVATA
ncbi:MAG TPA: sucrase ferredoxin [Solirubrobacteraceae bacterium]|nr:sucrase ferredoxin [Solirubrobacteraceae bacterium]